ncbi:MAG: CPBP family intramembrane glutamic endopeptidase [Bacillota bacterium]
MFLKKISGKNYLIALLILLALTTILVISAFAITAFYPETLGQKPYNYEMETACEFEPWSIQKNDLYVLFPEGGTIITLQESDYLKSVLLVGEGTFRCECKNMDTDSTGGIFMVIENELFDEMRGDNIFTPVENQQRLNNYKELVEKQKGIPSIWNDIIPLTYHANEGLIHYYFISPEGEPLLPPETKYTSSTLAATFLLHIIFTLIVILVITIFSLDHSYSRYWIHLRKTTPGFLSLGLIPALALIYYVTETIPVLQGWSEYYAFFGYATIILAIILLHRYKIIDYLDFGLRRDKIGNGYFMAVFVGLLIIFLIRGFPEGIALGNGTALTKFPLLFLLLGLPREMIWRGYIQTFLSRILGPNLGLIVMIILAGAVHYAFIYTTETWRIFYPYMYLEIAVLVPGMAAILGYLYLRTENILSCALLHTLLLFLPSIIVN